MPATGVSGATALIAGVFYTLAFCLGHRWGSHSTGEFRAQQAQLLMEGERLRYELQTAEALVAARKNKVQQMGADVVALMTKNAELTAENQRMGNEQTDWVDLNNACIDDTVRRRREWNAADAAQAVVLGTLENQERDLLERSAHLRDTDGLRAIILLNTVKRLSGDHRDLRTRLQLSQEAMTNARLDGLIDKWAALAPEQMQIGEHVAPLQASELDTVRQLLPSHLNSYDEDRDAKHVFLPRKDRYGEPVVPTWNTREGTQPLRHGTFYRSEYLPTTTVAKQFRTLYDYATCAVGLNITQLMYPSAFRVCPQCEAEHLHDAIETPVVLFCDQCVPQHFTDEFKLLCNGYLDKSLYGSGLFWRARSRLTFKGQYLARAERWLNESGIDQQRGFIAARMPTTVAACSTNGRPVGNATLCYQHLLKAAPQVFRTPAEQCNPGLEKYVSGLEKVLRRTDLRDMYISTDASDEQWLAFKVNVTAKYPLRLHRRPATGRATADAIIDLHIASLAQRVVVNRYDTPSTIIAEEFMLRRRLTKTGIMVW
eukprot:TRINITY_DN15069_c0_g1_i1.p1 TRINITY_DN15069_c0_g1~~TRINITY_DN15069_c0_g1_i1.p1  ORF type:complete len:542 (+),score=146.49 TRINITY_DN15069_c0_g1_i1:48-1673(+)